MTIPVPAVTLQVNDGDEVLEPYKWALAGGRAEAERRRPGDAARIRWRLPPYPAPDGPFLTRPGLQGSCTRANVEQAWGQNGHIKNDLEQ